MLTVFGTNWRRGALLCGSALGICGLLVLGPARAQTAGVGGLDLDAGAAAPVAAPAATPAPAPAPAPAAQPVAAAPAPQQPAVLQNIQAGIVAHPLAGEAPASPAPAAAPAATPAPAPAAAPPTSTAATTPVAPAPAAAPPAPAVAPVVAEPVMLNHPTVVDTAKLADGSKVVSLYGIEGMAGEPAQQLQGFIAQSGGALTCQAQTAANFVCLLPDGSDVAEAALVNGAARTTAEAPDAYRAQEASAQAARRGIWASLPPPPVVVQNPTVQDTATLVAGGQTYVLDGLIGLGVPYAGQLQGYIEGHGDSLSCQVQDASGHYICMLSDGTDLATVALVNGAARVDADAPDTYRLQQGDALTNHRGFWLNPPADVLIAANATVAEPCCAFVPGDAGGDGVAYVGGMPTAVIDGETVFLVFGAGLGWGYYDHWHHWRGAPDRYRSHMERFHPEGHGLRGYRSEATLHGGVGHPGGVVGHPGGPGAVGHVGGVPGGGPHPGYAGPGAAPHPGYGAPGGHPGGPGPGGHPGYAGPGGHPGMPGPGGHPTALAGRPGGAPGGFVHPGVASGGFHPGAGGAPHVAAPAPHPSGGGGVVKKHP